MYVQVCVMDVRSKLETSHFNQCSSTPQIVVLVMALVHYFQSTTSLATAKEARVGDTVTQSTNTAILHEVQQSKQLRKCKAYTTFIAEQLKSCHRKIIMLLSMETQADFEGGQLGDSTVRLFKKCHMEESKKAKHSRATVAAASD